MQVSTNGSHNGNVANFDNRYWGGLSDRIGRKPVLLLGCAGTVLSLLVVGLSTSFWMALLGRALGGFLNGNIGVVQTMVGEITINPKHERELSFTFTPSEY